MRVSWEEASPAEKLAWLPEEDRQAFLSQLSDEEVAALTHDFFGFWARRKQVPPEACDDPSCGCGGLWSTLVILCGRGWGKTRVLSEIAHDRAWRYPGIRIIIVSPTAGDARKVVSEGESGLIATAKPWNAFTYKPATNQGAWANGSHILILSADEPNRARGPQSHLVLCDEFAAWPRAVDDDATRPGWSMLQNLKLGLRLPARPGWAGGFRNQMIIATTPRPTEVIKQLVGVAGHRRDPKTHVVYGHTRENASNLSEEFFHAIVGDLEGTRLGQQELEGAILIDAPGALWKTSSFQYVDESAVPDLRSVVVAVDPNVGGVDETGIVVCGVGPAPGESAESIRPAASSASAAARRLARINGYVIADRSLAGARSGQPTSPDAWGRRAIEAFHDYKADVIVAESNNGGDLVAHTLKTIDPSVPVKLVHASRGKQTRAEPIAALYEQGRVWHVGRLRELEDQLTSWDPINSRKSPDRLDALVWGLHHLMGKGKIHHRAAPITVAMPRAWSPFD